MCTHVCTYVYLSIRVGEDSNLGYCSSGAVFERVFFIGLELAMEARLASWHVPGSTCLCFPNSGVLRLYGCAWIFLHEFWGFVLLFVKQALYRFSRLCSLPLDHDDFVLNCLFIIWAWAHACCGTCIEVREQSGGSVLLLLCHFWGLGLVANAFNL